MRERGRKLRERRKVREIKRKEVERETRREREIKRKEVEREKKSEREEGRKLREIEEGRSWVLKKASKR